jgi:hypothetical protein
MADSGFPPTFDPIVIQLQAPARCSKCGAFIKPDNSAPRALLAADRLEGALCDACTLAQPGSDEFV